MTDFKINLEGKIKNTNLPKSKSLLPLFEAIVNSIQSIEDLGISNGEILITIVRKKFTLSLTDSDDDSFAAITGFEICDNGIGFNDVNYESFLTSDSKHKESKGSKGIGRFTWLKAFTSVEVSSCYADQEIIYNRCFKFNCEGISSHKKQKSTDSHIEKNKTIVKLLDFRTPYSTNIPHDYEVIGRRILEHCLPYFLLTSVPFIKVIDRNHSISLNDYLQDCIKNSLKTFHFNIKDQEFICLNNSKGKDLRIEKSQIVKNPITAK
jgi:hypothetical protein